MRGCARMEYTHKRINMKLPYVKLFWRDWQSDSGLRSCSLAARGLWFEMLCIMAQAEPYGHLIQAGKPIGDVHLARLVGSDEREIKSLRDELLSAGVPSVENEVWISRRLVRDNQTREKLSAAGKKGGNPNLTNPEDSNTIVHSPYSIGSSPPLEAPLSHPLSLPLTPPLSLAINNPTLEDCIKASATIGMRKEDVEACFHYYSAQGWKSGKGVPLVNLSSVLARWKSSANTFKKPEVKQENETPKWKKLEILKEHVSKFTAQNPHPDRWTQEQRDTLKKNREEIKKLEMEMVK